MQSPKKKPNKNRADILTVNELVAQVKGLERGLTNKQSYATAKNRVFRFEPSNYQNVVFYATGKDWWRLGGHSALIYAFKMAPLMGKHGNFKNDTDFNDTFEEGVISIPRMRTEELKEGFALNHAKIVFQNEWIMIFRLDKAVLRSEIKQMREKVQAEIAEYNSIMMVDNVYPHLMGVVRGVLPIVYSMYAAAQAPQRTAFLDDVMEHLKSIYRGLVAIGNKEVEILFGLRQIDGLLNRLMADISMATTAGVIPSDKALHLGRRLHEARVKTRTEIKKQQERDQKQRGAK